MRIILFAFLIQASDSPSPQTGAASVRHPRRPSADLQRSVLHEGRRSPRATQHGSGGATTGDL